MAEDVVDVDCGADAHDCSVGEACRTDQCVPTGAEVIAAGQPNLARLGFAGGDLLGSIAYCRNWHYGNCYADVLRFSPDLDAGDRVFSDPSSYFFDFVPADDSFIVSEWPGIARYSLDGGFLSRTGTDGGHCFRLAWNGEALFCAMTPGVSGAKSIQAEPDWRVLVADAGVVDQLAADSAQVYWLSGGALSAVPLDGGPPVALVAAGVSTFALGDPGALYFTSADAGTVSSMPRSGGPPAVIAAQQDFPWAVAADGVDVYWTTARRFDGAGTVRRSLPDGGAARLVADQQFQPVLLVLDRDFVYWGTSNPFKDCDKESGSLHGPLVPCGGILRQERRAVRRAATTAAPPAPPASPPPASPVR